MNLLSSPQHVKLLEQAISSSALRHKVISNNIANVNTPGFKRSEVVFEEVLRENINNLNKPKLNMALTNAKHLDRAKVSNAFPAIKTINDNSVRTDANNVDIEAEMANMAKNNIYYDAAIQQLNRHFTSLKSAINEGRR